MAFYQSNRKLTETPGEEKTLYKCLGKQNGQPELHEQSRARGNSTSLFLAEVQTSNNFLKKCITKSFWPTRFILRVHPKNMINYDVYIMSLRPASGSRCELPASTFTVILASFSSLILHGVHSSGIWSAFSKCTPRILTSFQTC